jgi:hypothetical protein
MFTLKWVHERRSLKIHKQSLVLIPTYDYTVLLFVKMLNSRYLVTQFLFKMQRKSSIPGFSRKLKVHEKVSYLPPTLTTQ